MSNESSFQTNNLAGTADIGMQISQQLEFPACVYLSAEMGAGKTTLCKSIIQAFGYSQAVTSPTYNLIQEYQVAQGTIFHMDLYRLEDPAELEFLAITDLWSPRSLFLVEWPERGVGYLMPATHEITLNKNSAIGEEFRQICLKNVS